MFKDNVIPCFTLWIECGGIISNILRETFETIDNFNLLPRINGVVPFTILDRHGSRIGLPFL